MEEFTFFSNTCIGHQMFVLLNSEYTNPFIGTLIVNDFDFVKLCNNLDFYLRKTPRFGQPSVNALQGNRRISNMGNYPVMFLDDIEIHWIHDSSELDILEKFNRRCERFFEKKRQNLCILSYSQLLVNHNSESISRLLLDFFKTNEHVIFLGPPKLLTPEITSLLNETKHFIIKPQWNNISLRRQNSVYHFNDQIQIKNDIINYLKQKSNYSFAQ